MGPALDAFAPEAIPLVRLQIAPAMPLKNPAASSPAPSAALTNALLVVLAVGCGLATLVARGRVSWPPTDLLANAYTLAGCLALVGPVVLARRDASTGGLGDLLWMTGGLLVWLFDVAAALRGGFRTLAWATPLGYQAMGLTMLAVLVAGWRVRGAGREWSWTNVAGWILGLFWVGMGLSSFLTTGHALGLAAR